MSIKPVDLQVMLPKTPEVARMNNDAQHRPDIMQQQQSSTVQQNAENSIRYVHSQDKANEASIREKQEKNKGEKKQDWKRNKGNYNADKKAGLQEESTTIDIKI